MVVGDVERAEVLKAEKRLWHVREVVVLQADFLDVAVVGLAEDEPRKGEEAVVVEAEDVESVVRREEGDLLVEVVNEARRPPRLEDEDLRGPEPDEVDLLGGFAVLHHCWLECSRCVKIDVVGWSGVKVWKRAENV